MFKSLLRYSPLFALLAATGAAVVVPAEASGAAAVARQDERRRQDPPPPPTRQDERRTNEQDRRDPPPPPPDDRRGGNQDQGRAPQSYRVKNVLGTKVSIQGDISIGTVDDIVFSDEGYVEYLIVNNDNQMRTVPWAAAKFNFEKKTATVNITQSQFQSIPSYTPERYPTFFAPAYRREVYGFYGISPRDMRRMDRR